MNTFEANFQMPEIYHTPALLNESMDGLDVKPGGTYLDLTLGGGGHCSEILRRAGENGRVLAFDQDADAIANLPQTANLQFANSNFRYLLNYAKYYGFMQADGILCDLGVSSHHFDTPGRGFSFRSEGPLDMRMNSSARLTAADVLNDYDEQALSDLFYHYGEFKNARRIAAAVAKHRDSQAFSNISELVDCLAPFCGKDRKKDLARMFQALRIEVNDEMGALKAMLQASAKVLKKGGRIAIISYHSIEDRIVKNFLRSGNFSGEAQKDFFGNSQAPFRPVGKVVVPTAEEIAANPRSRSAKLRVAEKI